MIIEETPVNLSANVRGKLNTLILKNLHIAPC